MRTPTAWALALAAALPALADDPRTERLARLEKVFWYCDYVATNETPRKLPVEACNRASDELKREKFADDFQRFLAWWRDNKQAEHAKVAAGGHGNDAVL